MPVIHSSVMQRFDGAEHYVDGTELLTRIAHGDDPDNPVRASALFRVVVELDKDDLDGIRLVRLEGDALWVLRREDLEAPLEQLNGAADQLASRNVLAGPAEAHRGGGVRPAWQRTSRWP
jgi:hypothetical protein